MLPDQLRSDSFGFVKLKPETKIPFEKGWQLKPYSFNEISNWIAEGNNYGVMGGCGNLIIIDSDDSDLSVLLFKSLPETFTVRSSKGFHFYYIVPAVEKKIVLVKDSIHAGEIISNGAQAVGPNCKHPAGVIYTIHKNLPIHVFF